MSWIKIDDGFADNRKFLRVGPLAGYLHIAAIAWSNRNLTDGFIPREQPPRLAAWHVVNRDLDPEVVGKIPGHEDAVSWPALVARLIDVGLWIERDDGDYEINDYLEYQRSSAQIREDRDKNASRQAKWRDGNRNGATNKPRNAPRNAVTNGRVTDAKKLEEESEELPPQPPASGGRKRDQDRFAKEMDAWAAQNFPGVQPSYVGMKVAHLRNLGVEPTVTALEPLVAPYRNSTEAAA